MRTRRLLGAMALTTLTAVGLAGCVKMDMHLDLQSDDTVDGSMIFAISRDFAEMMGQSPEDLAAEMQGDALPVPEGAGDFTQEPYDDGEYVGTEMRFEGAPLEEMEGSGTAEELSIVREGDEFVVSGTMDLSDAGLGAEEGGEMMAGLMEGFDIQIAVTFPGAVSDHNGELDGNTVTWTPTYGEVTEISARGSAIEGGGGSDLPLALIIGIGAAVLLAVGLILFFVLRSRKSTPAPAAGAPYDAAAPGDAAAPQTYTPQPGYATPPAGPAAPPPAPPQGGPAAPPPAPPAHGPTAPPPPD